MFSLILGMGTFCVGIVHTLELGLWYLSMIVLLGVFLTDMFLAVKIIVNLWSKSCYK